MPCNQTLGRMNLHIEFGRYNRHGFGCHASRYNPHPSTADYYRSNAVGKLTAEQPGYWYSSLSDGYCGGKGGGCTWRVVAVDKIVTQRMGLAWEQ